MDKERFTMLLLDPGEIFFEDFSIQIKLIESTLFFENWTDGRLKLCSKSLVFTSRDISLPLIKIQFKETLFVKKCDTTTDLKRATDTLVVKCKQYVEMLEGNILAPYKFIHKPAEFHFAFNYIQVDDCLPQILQLLRAATLPNAEQNAMIMAIVYSIQSRFSFDTSWLEDLYEEIIFEVQANKVMPLIVNPGRVLVTTSRLYFQPYNNMDQHPVLKINLKDIKNIIKRRFLLRQVGIEIKWVRAENKKDEYIYLSTNSQEERDSLYSKLLDQPSLKIETIPQNQMTMQWQNGYISNFDYLLYINSLADRTFHDLTQYPVMPWVIQDYTSKTLDLNNPDIYRDLTKPIGALEPERLRRLQERYEEMSEPKFLYGSHYSAPGFVLFYLVRKYPQYMLCLQNGRFDHPDRMFNSLFDVWKNVTHNMSDFKELIPEFYDTTNSGDFLVNSYGIDFGYRYDGMKIGDVHLPPWAKSPADFVQKLRDALESDWVSKNLHHWIDLIFGYKQKGEEAFRANNVFFHLCYEGAIDLDTIKDINERHGLEVQIMEFGQIPKQIFTLPHPRRNVASDLSLSSHLSNHKQSFTEKSKTSGLSLKALITCHSHKDCITGLTIINDGTKDESIVSVGVDGVMKIHSVYSGKLIFSIPLSPVPLSSCVSFKTSFNNNVVVAGSHDNTLILFDVEFGKIIDVLHGHEDAISCLVYCKEQKIIISGSWDCTAIIWKLGESCKKNCLVKQLIVSVDYESKITCLNVPRDETILACGTENGEILLWDLSPLYNFQFVVKETAAKINAITFEPETKNIVFCGSDNTVCVIDVHTKTKIYFITLEENQLCLEWLGSLLLIGTEMGDLRIWNPQTAGFISKFNCHKGSLTSISASKDSKRIATSSEDMKIIVWECG